MHQCISGHLRRRAGVGVGGQCEAAAAQDFESEVAASFGPFVGLLGQDGADEADEGRWAELDPHDEVNVYPAFANMVRRNRAKAFPIAVDSTLGRGDGFDPASLLEALDGLTGDYYDQLRERARIGNEWAIPDIELFLIRTAVRCGVPIANVIGTTVWYSKVWESDLRDVLAVVATDAVKAAEWPVRKTCQGCSATQMSAGLE